MAENIRDTGNFAAGIEKETAKQQDERKAKPSPQGTKQQGETAKSSVGDKRGDAAGQTKEGLHAAKETVANQASQAAASVRQKSREFAHQQKDRVTHELEACCGALKGAAERYNEESQTNLGQYAGAAAEQLERAKSYLETRDMEQLLDDAESAVRDHREMFYGACFIAGLGLARFLKASARSSTRRADGESQTGAQRTANWSRSYERSPLHQPRVPGEPSGATSTPPLTTPSMSSTRTTTSPPQYDL